MDLRRLLQRLQRSCPNLTFLSLIGNGACPNGLIYGASAVEYARYRREVATALPTLQFLDSSAVSIIDRPAPAIAVSGDGSEASAPPSRESLRGQLPDSSTATLEFFDTASGATTSNPLLRKLFNHSVTSLALLADKWIVMSGTPRHATPRRALVARRAAPTHASTNRHV